MSQGRGRIQRLEDALGRMERASGLMQAGARQDLQQAIHAVLALDDAPAILHRHALRLEESGLFAGTPWEDPHRLQSRLVSGGLLGDRGHQAMDSANLLRMLAHAEGTTQFPAADAKAFLEHTIALNLDFLFPRATEASRDRDQHAFAQATRIFTYLIDHLADHDLLPLVVDEIEAVCRQRPIWTEPVRRMVRLASKLPRASQSADPRVDAYVEAILGPSPMSRRFRDAAAYRDALRQVDDAAIQVEAEEMAASLRTTGLACPHHAVLLRFVAEKPDLLAVSLGLDSRGREELGRHGDLVADLVRGAVQPATSQAAYGLARLLERGLLDRGDVVEGLRRLGELRLHPDVERRLRNQRGDGTLSPEAWLLSGALRVLGQPLGLGQGRNPTCQAARGISMWSQHRPGYLLDVLCTAAAEDDVALYFGDDELHSRDLPGGMAWDLDPDLDPVSLVLVPHLDRLYSDMMRRVAYLGGDGHRWVNPGLYGRIVPNGFATCFEAGTWHVADHRGFLRRFWATHHPDYQVRAPLYANPVGIMVTNLHGDLLGLHAVSLQRVETGPGGDVRAYFYNPNDEGRQDWGQGIRPSIHGQGEVEGESSLPFPEFASRLYAFHFDPFLEGDAYAVPAADIEAVGRVARESWGRAYSWPQPPVESSLATENS